MFFNDTYCQVSERFITKEQWNKHFHCSRQLHREVDGYWPAYFPQKNLVAPEKISLESVVWKIFFATRDIEEVVNIFLVNIFYNDNKQGRLELRK